MTTGQLGPKQQEIMTFLHSRIFDPILQSPEASEKLKQGVRLTIMRMEQRDAAGMIQYLLVRDHRHGAQHWLCRSHAARRIRPL